MVVKEGPLTAVPRFEDGEGRVAVVGQVGQVGVGRTCSLAVALVQETCSFEIERKVGRT